MNHRPHPATLGVVVVAAGSGTRLAAGMPKAFVQIAGRTLIEHAVRTVTQIAEPGHLVIVVPDAAASLALTIIEGVPAVPGWQVSIAPGGRERHESVRFGLAALPDEVDTVLVHDAARPCTPHEVFERVARTVRESHHAVIPAIAVVDTLKRVDADGIVQATIDRAPLVAVQTPQGFTRAQLHEAHELAAREHGPCAPTDDAELVQRAGGTVRTVAGSPEAHKLTVPSDMAILEALYAARAGNLSPNDWPVQ